MLYEVVKRRCRGQAGGLLQQLRNMVEGRQLFDSRSAFRRQAIDQNLKEEAPLRSRFNQVNTLATMRASRLIVLRAVSDAQRRAEQKLRKSIGDKRTTRP